MTRHQKQPDRPRLLLAQRAEVEFYPPVLHQARILNSLAQVTVLDAADSETSTGYMTHPNVRRVRINSKKSAVGMGPLVRAGNLIAFRNCLRREMRTQFDIVIAFEPDAAAISLGCSTGRHTPVRVIHLHEDLDIASYSESPVSRWAIRRMVRNLGRADLVVVADRERAKRLEAMTRSGAQIVTVMNCPPLVNQIPESRLIPALKAYGKDGCSIVHYQGSVGRDHGLEVIIRSMSSWPTNSVLAVIGRGSEGYVAGLNQLAAECGVGDRVLFLGWVSYDRVMSYAAGAAVGVTLLDTARDNWRFAAGASNKRFEYAALGIPQVTNYGPGIDELFRDPGIALTADHSSPAEVGARISFYLLNAEARMTAGRKARALHLARYNYEHEYAPVLETLRLA